jgi:hypothetical protein
LSGCLLAAATNNSNARLKEKGFHMGWSEIGH